MPDALDAHLWIGTVRARSPTRDPLALRWRLAPALADVEPAATTWPPSAIVCLRRVGDPLPGGWRSPAWPRAVRASIDALARRAVRPAAGPVPAGAEAVAFLDRAEMLSCLVRDLHEGQLGRWWWPILLRGRSPSAVARAWWIESPEEAPAALEALARTGHAARAVASLDASVADAALEAVARAHAVPAGAVLALRAWSRDRRDPSSDATAAALRAPEACAPGLPPAASALLALGLALRRAPRAARSLTPTGSHATSPWAAANAPARAIDDATARATRSTDATAMPSREAAPGDDTRPPLPARSEPRCAATPAAVCARESTRAGHLVPPPLQPPAVTANDAPARSTAVIARDMTTPSTVPVEAPTRAPVAPALEPIPQAASAPSDATEAARATTPRRDGDRRDNNRHDATTEPTIGDGHRARPPAAWDDAAEATTGDDATHASDDVPALPLPDAGRCATAPLACAEAPAAVGAVVPANDRPPSAAPTTSPWLSTASLPIVNPPTTNPPIADPSWRHARTELGGLFFLVNVMLGLGLYPDFTRPGAPGFALPPWDALALLGRLLLDDDRPADPLWPLLAWLAGRDEAAPTLSPHELPAALALAARVEARLARALPTLPWRGRVDAAARLHAEVTASPTRVDVRLPLDALPVAVRLAGLDRDPGWVPAAGRSLRFHFA